MQKRMPFERCAGMTGLDRKLTGTELDAAYDNTGAVADSARLLAGFDERSRLLAERRPERLDLRYGVRERQRIDYFASSAVNAPLLVFIHGGYWQMRCKEIFRFLAAGPLRHGIHVAPAGLHARTGPDADRHRRGNPRLPALAAGARRSVGSRLQPDRGRRLVGGRTSRRNDG